MTGPAPDWLVRRPIAHRGLHAAAEGRIENGSTAAEAAAARGFAIECDVQLTADGEAVVFHDFTLDRLTEAEGPVARCSAAALAGLRLKGSEDGIPRLGDLLALVAGRVPLVCEIKSRFDGDMRLADRAAAVAEAYGGPLAFKSFDPAVVGHLRRSGTGRPLGIVAEAAYDDPDWAALSPAQKRDLAAMLHFGETRPDFLSWHVADLPHAAPQLCRAGLGLPVMAWTVRTPEQRQRAANWADQMVFEGFVP